MLLKCYIARQNPYYVCLKDVSYCQVPAVLSVFVLGTVCVSRFILKILLCLNPHVLSSFLPSCVIAPLPYVFHLFLLVYPLLIYLNHMFLSFYARMSPQFSVSSPALHFLSIP